MANKIVKYIVVRAFEVNEQLEKGFELYSVPMVIQGIDSHVLYQAMVLREDDEEKVYEN